MAGISTEVNKHYHFIGIGGIGMSGIAKLLLRCGVKVSGSDLKPSSITEELRGLGAEIFLGHNPLNIKDADLIVYSSAIKEDNPEIKEARQRGIPLIRRAQALAQLMQDKTVITVTGSHGKTTTTSLVAYLLLEAGFQPTVAVGGILRNIDSNACLGDGEFFVAEADESDGSFLYYRPNYSIITNIDYEHLDYYKDIHNEIAAFADFLNNTRQDGCAFICSDDVNLKNIAEGIKGLSPKGTVPKIVFFGLKSGADIYPKHIKLDGLSSEFDCYYKNNLVGNFSLGLGGEHNISNSLAVIALGMELKISLEIMQKALAGYKGACRRLEIKFKDKNYLVLDDYAHHPTEIKATLAAIRNLKSKRIIAVFQPHRFSRTKLLLEEFGRSFALADYIIVTDIYPAGEPPIEGVNARNLYAKIKEQSRPDKPVYFLPKEDIAGHILKIIKPDDLIITLGAGDITRVNDELVERFKRQSPL